MGEARIVSRNNTLLIGMSFFGNPFAAGDEITALWTRFRAYLDEHPHGLGEALRPGGPSYEVHVASPEMDSSGRYEVFVGREVSGRSAIPIACSAKVLPAAEYAVLTVRGEAIVEDWMSRLYAEIVPGMGREADESFGFELYDERFKGMDRLAVSELDYYVPLLPLEES